MGRWWMDRTSALGTAYDDILLVPLPGVLIWEWWELPKSQIPLSLGLIVDAAQLKMDGMKGRH
jgi:hypothetical protein